VSDVDKTDIFIYLLLSFIHINVLLGRNDMLFLICLQYNITLIPWIYQVIIIIILILLVKLVRLLWVILGSRERENKRTDAILVLKGKEEGPNASLVNDFLASFLPLISLSSSLSDDDKGNAMTKNSLDKTSKPLSEEMNETDQEPSLCCQLVLYHHHLLFQFHL